MINDRDKIAKQLLYNAQLQTKHLESIRSFVAFAFWLWIAGLALNFLGVLFSIF